MAHKVQFEAEVWVPSIVDGAVERDSDGDELGWWVVKTLTAEYSVEPAQRGGRDDPSWDAYPYLDGDIVDENGRVVETCAAIEEAATEAMQADYESRCESAAEDEAADHYEERSSRWDGYETPWNYEG
jgi:hypothetical protein